MKNYQAMLQLFEAHLAAYSGSLSLNRPSELYQPEAYILSLGGKRLRPLLALIACDLFEAKPEKALNAALCIELFHNFSLIHDDILDEAPLRRGQPTVHKKWNTNIAILSGDVMLVKAMQCLEKYEPAMFRDLSSLFTSTSIAVCEGQQMDMNFEVLDEVSTEAYIEMITLKTAVLLGCSLQMGARIAGADQNMQNQIYEFGRQIGIAFQLRDDLLDAFAPDKQQFGKQVGGDIISNKKTYLLLKAIESAGDKSRQQLTALQQEKDPHKKVEATLELFRQLKVEQACEKAIDLHTSKAIAALDSLSADKQKKAELNTFALELMNRQK